MKAKILQRISSKRQAFTKDYPYEKKKLKTKYFLSSLLTFLYYYFFFLPPPSFLHHSFNKFTKFFFAKILSCNPILEAFGNSKTLRNDNSSRFGKYVTLLINKETKKITGARLLNYLLEKSRITKQAENEKNYHIFYFLLGGANSSLMEELGLNNLRIQDFEYLNKGTKIYKNFFSFSHYSFLLLLPFTYFIPPLFLLNFL